MSAITLHLDTDNDDFQLYDGGLCTSAVDAVLEQVKEHVWSFALHADQAMSTYNLRDRNGNTVGTLTVQE